jgi:hypothetical protein
VLRLRGESRDEAASFVVRAMLSADPSVSAALDPVEALAAAGRIVDRDDGAFVLADAAAAFGELPLAVVSAEAETASLGELFGVGDVAHAYLEEVDGLAYYRSSPEDFVDDRGRSVDQLALPAGTEGVAWNRNPDGSAGAPPAPHSTVQAGVVASPGTRASGAPW